MNEDREYVGTDNLEAMAAAQRYNRFLVELAARYLPMHTPCLDFGAGIGTFSAMVANEGFQVVALDPERRHIEAMQARGLTTLTSLADTPDGFFGGAFSFNVLEHIEDDEACLEQIHRVLRPGARLVVFVPALPWLWTTMDTKVGHHRRYTRSELGRKASRAGFTIERLEYADSLGVLATLAYKVMGSANGDISVGSVKAYDSIAFPVSRTLDRITHRLAGKNVLAVARKP